MGLTSSRASGPHRWFFKHSNAHQTPLIIEEDYTILVFWASLVLSPIKENISMHARI